MAAVAKDAQEVGTPQKQQPQGGANKLKCFMQCMGFTLLLSMLSMSFTANNQWLINDYSSSSQVFLH